MDTSYLAQQVNTIIGQLHGLFDEIGVPNHDRETREEEVRETVVHTVAAAPMLTAHGSSLRRCPTP
jgi:protein regulator of cytokinesis 1